MAQVAHLCGFKWQTIPNGIRISEHTCIIPIDIDGILTDHGKGKHNIHICECFQRKYEERKVIEDGDSASLSSMPRTDQRRQTKSND